jgi:hypothetical protein
MLTQTTLSSESQITIDVVKGKHVGAFAAYSNRNTPSSTNKNNNNAGQCEQKQQGMQCDTTPLDFLWKHRMAKFSRAMYVKQNGAPRLMAQ